MYVVEKQMNFTDYKDLEISKKNKKQRHSLVYIKSERERKRGRVKENLLIKNKQMEEKKKDLSYKTLILNIQITC